MKCIYTKERVKRIIEIVTSDEKVKKNQLVLDPMNSVNRVKKVCRDKTVILYDDCGTYLHSVKKIVAINIDGIIILQREDNNE